MNNITKTFAGVTALNDVSFCVDRGDIHALMGENGAGKSTLIKILTGIHKADSGDIEFDGKKEVFTNALSAQHAGISTIYQELNMIPYLTVSENIFLGRYPKNKSGIDWKAMNEKAQALVDEIGVDIDVKMPLNTYGTARQQIISILRAISLDSKLIVMDEPTSSLDTKEVKILFGIMDQLKAKGVSIIFISHRLDEVYAKCDKITVLKDSRLIGTYDIEELSEYQLLQKMIGNKNLELAYRKETKKFNKDDVALKAEHLIRVPYVNDVSFDIKRGEIVGLSGLLGSGRTEIARIIFGCDVPDRAEIFIEGKKTSIKSPQDAAKAGMAFCTENRREEGLFPNVSVQNNMAICSLKSLCKRGFINSEARRKLCNDYVGKMSIKSSSNEQLIKNLSGGNQQKVIVSRWLATKPKLIILDEPTRGIDVGAKAEIEKLIRELADDGISVLLISSEMPELVRNCDRIVVLRDGRIMGELVDDEITEVNIVQTIAGSNSNKGDK